MADRERWAEPVEAATEALGPAMARAARGRKEAEAKNAARRRLRGPYDDLFVAVASWFEASYRVAGRDDRAEAVRPSKRRKGLRLADERRLNVRQTSGVENQPRLALVAAPAKGATSEIPAADFSHSLKAG